jgi:hypothetical protein
VTEADWLAATDPEPMLAFLRDSGRASERKLRLFAAACCRIRGLADREHLRTAAVAEQYADGAAHWWERAWGRLWAWPGVLWEGQ